MELNFNSVETIPGLNASAAFQVDSGKVFKEDVDMVSTIIDKSLSYMPWGGDNMMPYNILKLIEDDELDNLLTFGIAQASLALCSLNRRFDSDTKEGGDWSTDIQEAVNMVCFTMRVHSNLVGSVPGKTQTNNSGSDKRELYTIAQALQKPYHDLLFTVHQMIIRFNGWQCCKVDVPFIQLTTLDEHMDAKEVTLGDGAASLKNVQSH